MPYISLNPATNKIVKTHTSWDRHHLAATLEQADNAQQAWAQTSFAERAADYGKLMAIEMGKPLLEACAEVEKCALICDYYAAHAQHFLQTLLPLTIRRGIVLVLSYRAISPLEC